MKRIAIAAVLAASIAPAAQAQSFFEDVARRTAESLAAKAAAAVQNKVVEAVTNPGAGGGEAAPAEQEAPTVMRPRARPSSRPAPETTTSDTAQPDTEIVEDPSPSR